MSAGLRERLKRLEARVERLKRTPQAVSTVVLQEATRRLFDVLADHLPGPAGSCQHDAAALREAAERIGAGEPNARDSALLAALPRADLLVLGEQPAGFIALVASLPDELPPELEAELADHARGFY